MSRRIHSDFNSAIARMEVDVAIVYDLFGVAAERPSRLVEVLAPDGDTHSGAPSFWDDWACRAAGIIIDARTRTEVAVRRCADHGFDDRDARVRGLAWCMLAEMEGWHDMGVTVTRVVAEAYDDYVVTSSDEADRAELPDCFATMMGTTVLVAASRQLTKAIEREYIETHAGADTSLMESSLSAAISFLDHPDSDRRLAAIQVVSRAAPTDVEACEAIYQKMIGDPDPEVRHVAIIRYAGLFRHTRNSQCLRRMAAIVLDENQPMLHRLDAYCGLLSVCGRSPAKDLQLPPDDERRSRLRDWAIGADWPVPVDWRFVDRCAKGLADAGGNERGASERGGVQ